jgi:hypothetical protein
MRLTVLLLLAGACTFQVAGLPVSPKTDPDPAMPSSPPSTTPPASTPPASTPSDAPDLSQLPDLATAPDMTRAPDLSPITVDCKQDCNLSVPGGTSETVVCELGTMCDVQCGAGAHCTVQCLGDARCSCKGMGCVITDCAPVMRCKGDQLVCNTKCTE